MEFRRIHYKYAEGTRPGQGYPLCEKELCDQKSSNGQCGDMYLTACSKEVSCAYCNWELLKQDVQRNPMTYAGTVAIVHFNIHPLFYRDGTGLFSHFAARCGKIHEMFSTPLSTRKFKEVSCLACIEHRE
jgi:hypothetical protein